MAVSGLVAVLGAGSMGTALALHMARGGTQTVLLATDLDGRARQAWERHEPHPALRAPFHDVPCVPFERWPEVLPGARLVVVAVSTAGLPRTLAEAGRDADPEAWVLATKGWQPGTLLPPSGVAGRVLGDVPVVCLAGPGLAAEIVAGAPTGLLCASRDREARRLAAAALTGPAVAVPTTSDVPGAETAAAYKNVAAMAVGIADGAAERYGGQSATVRSYANARAAVFARALLDMNELVRVQGGRVRTVLGLAGAGDLHVTCQNGRNGRFGRLLGGGTPVAAALRAIGSTVEGVLNAPIALELAARAGIDLPTASMVDIALRDELAGERAPERLRGMLLTALALETAATA